MNTWVNSWTYKGKIVTSLEDFKNPDKVVGFVYKITNLIDGKFYIGKKSVFHSKKTRISKKEKTATGTRKRFKKVVKESDWNDYYGSCKELHEDIKVHGKSYFSREIITVCYSKKYLNFHELELQIVNQVLKVNSYNGNILGRYYRKDMIN
jgi:hypothetical protein